MRAELGAEPPVSFEPGVYGATAGSLLGLIRRQPPAALTVMIAGHDPGVPELALALAGSNAGQAAGRTPDTFFGQIQAKFLTAAIAVVELCVPSSSLRRITRDWPISLPRA